MTIMLVTICVLVAVAFLVVGAHLWNHSKLRRSVLFDRQDLFHSSDAFHVVSAVKLKPDQELLEAVGRYVKGIEQQGAEVIYAGKVAFPRPRKSQQMPDLEWEAFVVSQYATRDTWETAAASANYLGRRANSPASGHSVCNARERRTLLSRSICCRDVFATSSLATPQPILLSPLRCQLKGSLKQPLKESSWKRP